MTERSAFENPTIKNPSLSTADLQKILSLQGDMLRQAVIGNDYGQLLDELCLLAESFTSNAVASVMLYDDSREALFVESGPSLSDEAIVSFNGFRAGDGSCGNAVFHNEAMYVCNTYEDPRWSNIVDIAKQFGICSCFSFPILNSNGVAIGSFAISSFEPRSPDGFNRALLDTCASICGVILERRTNDELRRQILDERIRTERIESLGILAGGIAHDFNNLLTTIMGNVDLTVGSLPDGVAKEGLQVAMKAIESASELTRQLLMIAKGHSPIREPNDICGIIKDSAEFGLHGSNVSLELVGLNSLQRPVMNVDGGQIGQLIQNLVINARQAMPDGGNVRIACDEIDQIGHVGLEDGKYLRIVVLDSGEGISEESLEHLFEPYYTTRDEGSGLGLFLCYSIVKSHGGRLTVDSELGTGTRFTIYLPHDVSVAARDVLSVSDRQTTLSGNILVMDDDDLVRQTMSRILRQLGCQVWEVADGAQAVECYKRRADAGDPIDVAILDLTIPGGMGGIEAKEQLRRFDSSAKIVVSSGYSAGEAHIDHKASGFDAVIPKPYGVADVKHALVGLLR